MFSHGRPYLRTLAHAVLIEDKPEEVCARVPDDPYCYERTHTPPAESNGGRTLYRFVFKRYRQGRGCQYAHTALVFPSYHGDGYQTLFATYNRYRQMAAP